MKRAKVQTKIIIFGGLKEKMTNVQVMLIAFH